MHSPFRAYQGDEPYIFVSYAHADAETVYPDILGLHNAGLNIWYDEGISPGNDWRDDLAAAIDSCTLFLLFVTPRSIESENCKREIHFAETRSSRILCVYLEPTSLPMGLELALGDRQAILKYQISGGEYAEKLERALHLAVESPGSLKQPSAPRTQTIYPQRWRPMIIGGILLLMISAGVGTWMTRVPDVELPDPSASEELETAPAIAILPFENLSPAAENAFFAAGIHEDVTQKIGEIPTLLVFARNSVMSYEGTTKAPAQIGSELGATHLLTGSVRRASGRVRISVQLVNAKTEQQVWNESYDRELQDVFAIQSEVAAKIADALQIHLDERLEKRIATAPTENLAAYDVFLKARQLENVFSTPALTQALSLYEQAISIAPGFAAAHAGVARVLAEPAVTMRWTKNDIRDRALREAKLALGLSEEIYESHEAMGYVLMRDGRYEEARPYLERALSIAPHNSRVRIFYAGSFLSTNDKDRAFAEIDKVIQIDPRSAYAPLQIALALESKDRAEAALSYVSRAEELEPDNVEVLGMISGFYVRNQYHFDNIATLTKMILLDPANRLLTAEIVTNLIVLDLHESAERWMERLEEMPYFYNSRQIAYLVYQREDDQAYELARQWHERSPEAPGAVYRHAGALAALAATAWREERQIESIALRQQALELLIKRLSTSDDDGAPDVTSGNRFLMSRYMLVAKSLGDHTVADAIARNILEFHRTQPFGAFNTAFEAGIAYGILGEEHNALEQFISLERDHWLPSHPWLLRWVTDDPYGLFGGIADDIAFRDVVTRLNERNAALRERIILELPELVTAAPPDNPI